MPPAGRPSEQVRKKMTRKIRKMRKQVSKDDREAVIAESWLPQSLAKLRKERLRAQEAFGESGSRS